MDQNTDYIPKKQLEATTGVLYLVGTPIGNIGDFSPRARYVLSKVSVIACEDTRYSGQFLKSCQIKANLLSFHKHNNYKRIPKLLELLNKGENIALITDAGLPGISDPGEDLVKATIKSGHKVICIPGPCAATTALVASGLPTHRFCFEGFLPSKAKDRKSILNIISQEKRTTVIYESPHKLLKLLKNLSDFCGEKRPLQIAREITKIHEEQIGSTIGEVLKYFSENKPRGEFTLVLGGATQVEKEISNSELISKIKVHLNNKESTSDAIRKISVETGYSKNFLYSLIHQNKKNDS